MLNVILRYPDTLPSDNSPFALDIRIFVDTDDNNEALSLAKRATKEWQIKDEVPEDEQFWDDDSLYSVEPVSFDIFKETLETHQDITVIYSKDGCVISMFD